MVREDPGPDDLTVCRPVLFHGSGSKGPGPRGGTEGQKETTRRGSARMAGRDRFSKKKIVIVRDRLQDIGVSPL